MRIKIINYNILYGFHKIIAPFNFEKDRLEKAKKIITKENPDILIFTEAAFGEKNPFGIFIDYKKEFGFPHVFFGKWGNYGWGNMILSKKPLNSYTFKFGNRTGIKSKIKLGEKTFEIIVIHPSPDSNFSEEAKCLKKELIIRNPLIITGDFNSISEEDSYDFKKLIKGFKTITKTPELSIKRLKNQKIIKLLKNHGFYDTLKKSKRSSTIPTKRYRTGNTDVRIDYLFASKNIKVIDSGIIKNKLTEEASDHYPIFSIIEV